MDSASKMLAAQISKHARVAAVLVNTLGASAKDALKNARCRPPSHCPAPPYR